MMTQKQKIADLAILDDITNDQVIRNESKKLIRAMELNMKDDAVESRSKLINRIVCLVKQKHPAIKYQTMNGLIVDYDWKTLVKADPKLFVWFGVIICLLAFSLGYLIGKRSKSGKSSGT